MREAGAACWRFAHSRWTACRTIAVVCGRGNNAGDGFVFARLARAAGCVVHVIEIDSEHFGADALACRNELIESGINPGTDPAALDAADLIVDAMFGIGVSRPVAGPFASIVERMNAAPAPVLSIDMPSGIDASTGACRGIAVRAAATISLIAAKQGLYTGDGPAYCGEITVDDLGLDPALHARVPASAPLFDARDVPCMFSPRRRTAHKGEHGHVLIIGGAPGYSGAARLAGEACARVGAGLVSLAVHRDGAAGANMQRPELMVHAVESGSDLGPLLARASIVAIGPGLGQSNWSQDLLSTVLESKLPLVVDADALNLLALEPARTQRWILTPHPGEAARLLRCTTADIHADRFAAAASLRERYGGIVILKGAGSIIADGALPGVIAAGNPGMASGGMGDVLTGVVAGLAAQGFELGDAARYGACIHAVAADRAAAAGERGLIAHELMSHLRALVNVGG
jgi:NAD(P)H-hydrate epimerase